MMQGQLKLQEMEGTRELWEMKEPSARPEVDNLLNPRQQEILGTLIAKFQDVLKERLGEARGVEHRVQMPAG